MHSGLDAVAVGGHPHGGVLVHHAAAGVEEVVVLADLRQALGTGIVREVVGDPIDIDEAVTDKIAVFIAPVFAVFQRASSARCSLVDVAAHVHIDFAACRSEDNAVVHFDRAIEYLAVFVAVVFFALVINKTIAKSGQQAGLFIKVIPRDVLDIGRHGMGISIGNVSLLIQPIRPFLKRHKAAEPRFPGNIVLRTVLSLAERSADQSALIVKGVGQRINGTNAGIHLVILLIEVVEIGRSGLISDRLPAGNEHAGARIVRRAVLFENARQFSFQLALAVKVEPELSALLRLIARQLLHTDNSCAVLIIAPCAVLSEPAFLCVFLQAEAVGKVSDRLEEMCAVVTVDVLTVVIGIQTVLNLILFLLCQRFEHMEVGIDVITEAAADLAVEQAVFIPCRLISCNQLQAAEHAQRIRSCGVNGFSLLNKVTHDRERIVLYLRRCQGKVLICKAQIRRIDRYALRCSQRDCDRCQRADTLGKLQQEVPRRASLLITTGKHIQKCREFFRDRHLGHIHRESIAGIHSAVGIDLIVSLLIVLIVGVGNISTPCKHPASTGRLRKIKVCLIVAIHIDRDLCCSLKRLVDRRSLRLDRGLFIRVAVGLSYLVHSGKFLIDRCLKFRQLTFLDCTDRQRAQLALSVWRKVKARDRPRLGVVKHQFRLRGVDTSALQLTDRLQRDLQKTELHIIGVDFHGISVIGCLERKLCSFAVDHIQGVFAEFHFRRLDDMQALHTEHGAVRRDKANLYVTERRCRKDITAQRTDAIVRHLQRRPLRKRDRAAGRRNAGYLNRQRAANRQIVIIRRNDRMVKHIRRFCGRHNKKRRADRAFITIRGPVDNGDRLRPLALRRIGSRTAAVQIDRGNTARILHDVRNFNGAATGRERLLTSVKRHQDDLPVISDSDAGTRCAVFIVCIRRIYNDFPVADKPDGAANSLLDLALMCIPFRTAADDGRSILENGKEVGIAGAVILHALHHQSTGGRSVAHVIEVCIDAGHGAVIWNVVLGIIRIGVLFLSRLHLIRQARHFPDGAVVIIIVCVNANVAARNVSRCKIVNDLLIVPRHRHLDLLLHTGSKHRGMAGKNFIVIILDLCLCCLIKIVSKRIAASTAKVSIDTIRQIAALKCTNAFVSVVGIVNASTDIILRRSAGKSVIEEEFCAHSIRQVGGEIVFHDRADRRAVSDFLKDIKGIQIAVQIQDAERMCIRYIMEKILVVVRADLLCHLLDRTGHTGIGRKLEQVTDVTGPAAEVSGTLVACVVGHVHCTEHMRKIDRIPVGKLKFIQAAQTTRSCRIGSILFGDIARKVRILRSAERRPCTGRILFHAGTDVIDDKRRCVFSGMLTRIHVSIFLQNSQGCEKITVLHTCCSIVFRKSGKRK